MHLDAKGLLIATHDLLQRNYRSDLPLLDACFLYFAVLYNTHLILSELADEAWKDQLRCMGISVILVVILNLLAEFFHFI